ncbi:MAG: hypothetical protein AB7P37_23015 [Ramlibacter sp.]
MTLTGLSPRVAQMLAALALVQDEENLMRPGAAENLRNKIRPSETASGTATAFMPW